MHYENCINHCVGVFRNSVVRLKSGHFIFVVSFGFEVWLGKDVHNGSGDRFGLVRGVGGAAYMGVSLARCNSYTNTQANRNTQTHNCTKNTQIWISSLSGRGVWPEFDLDLDSLLDVWFGKHVSSQVSQCFDICAHLKTSKIQGGALKWCIRKILPELEVAPPYELLTLLTLLAIHALHEKNYSALTAWVIRISKTKHIMGWALGAFWSLCYGWWGWDGTMQWIKPLELLRQRELLWWWKWHLKTVEVKMKLLHQWTNQMILKHEALSWMFSCGLPASVLLLILYNPIYLPSNRETHNFEPFLSDPSPIIGYACHSLTDSLTDSLTHSLPFSKLESDHCLPLSLTHWLTFLS